MSIPPPTPAGWFDDPTTPGQKKYWDGTAWTEHTAPAGAIPSAKAGMSATSKGLIIGGSVLGGLVALSIIVGIVGAATRGPDPVPVGASAEPTPTTSTTTPSPTPVEPSPTPTLQPELADPATFRAQAHSHLDDMSKDLDDMVITLDQGGFWRLLSNSLELSFNLGQLQALDTPASVQPAYTDALVALEAGITALDDPVFAEDDPGVRAAIDNLRAQIAGLHSLVDQAQ